MYYDYFNDPEYLKSAQDLKRLSQEVEQKKNEMETAKDPNGPLDVVNPVGDNLSLIKETGRQALKPVSELKPIDINSGTMNNAFQPEKALEESGKAAQKALESSEDVLQPAEEVSKWQGSGNVSGIAGAAVGLGMDVYTTASTRAKNYGSGLANAGKLAASGATLGMQVAGPYGAIIGGAAGFIYGGVDAVLDVNKNQHEAVVLQQDLDKEKTMKRLQGERTKDGMDSLTKLTALRKQQQEVIG